MITVVQPGYTPKPLHVYANPRIGQVYVQGEYWNKSQEDEIIEVDASNGFETDGNLNFLPGSSVAGSLKVRTNNTGLGNIDTSLVVYLGFCFESYDIYGTAETDQYHEIASWNTSRVRSFAGLFQDLPTLITADGHREYTPLDLSGWDTSSAIVLAGMFLNNNELKVVGLSDWDTSKVIDLTNFASSGKFNEDISKWDVCKVQLELFNSFCTNNLEFNQDLSGWKMSFDSEPIGFGAGSPMENQPHLWPKFTVGCEPVLIGNAVITGANSVCKGSSNTYTVSTDGNATSLKYYWITTDSLSLIDQQNKPSTDIVFNTEGNHTVTCTVVKLTSEDKIAEATFDVTVTDCSTPPPPPPPPGDPSTEFHFRYPNQFFTSRQDQQITTRDTAELNDYEKGIGRTEPVDRTLDKKVILPPNFNP